MMHFSFYTFLNKDGKGSVKKKKGTMMFGKKKETKKEMDVNDLLKQIEKTRKLNESLFTMNSDLIKASNKMLERRY